MSTKYEFLSTRQMYELSLGLFFLHTMTPLLCAHSRNLTAQKPTLTCGHREAGTPYGASGNPHRHNKELQTESGSDGLWLHVMALC